MDSFTAQMLAISKASQDAHRIIVDSQGMLLHLGELTVNKTYCGVKVAITISLEDEDE